MAGNRTGGIKARETNLREHGADFYKNIGAKGGSKTKADGCKPKGFAANPERARLAGAIGGSNSRRGKEVTSEDVHRARMLRERGYTWGEIGKTMDCSRERARYLFLRSETVDKSIE